MTQWPRPCLCLVTDRRAVNPAARTAREEVASLEAFLAEAIDAGIDIIQIRERSLDAGQLYDLVLRTIARARSTRTRVMVNDRADVALAAGADGVHLRGDGPPSARVRELRGPGFLIGRSIHDPAETADEADLFVFGTLFRTASKPADVQVAGLDVLAEAARRSTAPVLAIGGITPERARECREAGAAGVAAISIFLPPGRSPHAIGPSAAVSALRAAWA